MPTGIVGVFVLIHGSRRAKKKNKKKKLFFVVLMQMGRLGGGGLGMRLLLDLIYNLLPVAAMLMT